MLVMSFAISSAVAEDTLIDALRGCQTVDQLLQLRDQLGKNPDNPALFDWICRLLVARRISRGLGARLLQQLHHSA